MLFNLLPSFVSIATSSFGMILPGDSYPAIDIIKLTHFIVNRETNVENTIGGFQLIDVNSWECYLRERIVDAEHYDIHRLSRINFETDILKRCKKAGLTLVIYGSGADRTTAVLSDRGYKAVLLTGNIKYFREIFPHGLLYPESIMYDIEALKETLENKRNSKRGGRVWRSTSASRLKSSDTRKTRAVTGTPVKTLKPWK